MVPWRCTAAAPTGSAPRTRGDGPCRSGRRRSFPSCSPHPRGWSRPPFPAESFSWLLPAPAGMVPPAARTPRPRPTAPRTRRDGPSCEEVEAGPEGCSPHPRGWSRPVPRGAGRARLLPAPAGMVPRRSATACTPGPAPRTRGDGPVTVSYPHARLSCSPHPLGWSHHVHRHPDQPGLLPAPAGMVPAHRTSRTSTATAPCTRGDGPPDEALRRVLTSCSPHPRGWSRPCGWSLCPSGLLPAPAGMVPSPSPPWSRRPTAPRTRGEGPTPVRRRSAMLHCSPHPRGWSQRRAHPQAGRGLLPAPAGMVPFRRCWWSGRRPAPRTREGGLEWRVTTGNPVVCSLHPRGLSTAGSGAAARGRLLAYVSQVVAILADCALEIGKGEHNAPNSEQGWLLQHGRHRESVTSLTTQWSLQSQG